MKLQIALSIARNILSKLEPECDIINIAGSCRREKPEVKDIEIVALPKMVSGEDLFGGPTKKERKMSWKEKVYELGIVEKGNPAGKYMQIRLEEHDINLDLFMPDDFDFFRQYVIRTGSADWVSRYVAGGWAKNGWCGSDAGLRLKSQ